jgi:hypothetical protein
LKTELCDTLESFDLRYPSGLLSPTHGLLRKEVIQPQVPLRLPCYDFIPITTHSLGTRFLTVSWYDFGNKGLS